VESREDDAVGEKKKETTMNQREVGKVNRQI
jgi:hypothetical protein